MPTWLVTGGAGFIGANLVRRILAGGDARVVVLDKLTYAGNLQSLAEVRADPRLAFVQGDIADRETVARVFREWPLDAVLNLGLPAPIDVQDKRVLSGVSVELDVLEVEDDTEEAA